MSIPKITDHKNQALNRLIVQYKGAEFIEALIGVEGDKAQELEAAFCSIDEQTELIDSEGAQLDAWGTILNQGREGLSDPDYKIRLVEKIAEYNSEGTPEDLIDIFSVLMNADTIQYDEIYPAEFQLQAINPNPIGTLSQVAQSLNRAKPAGVGVNAIATTANPFVFENDASGNGFDDFNAPGGGGDFAQII